MATNEIPRVQVTMFDPNVEVHVHRGAVWTTVVQFGSEFTPHSTWYLTRETFDQLVDNLLMAQTSMTIADAEERMGEYPKPGEPAFPKEAQDEIDKHQI